jgi:hypothetical protein
MSKSLFLFLNENLFIFNSTAPLASFYDIRQGTIKTDYNQTKKVMMTVGTDRTIKVN